MLGGAAGDVHTLLWTDAGALYSFGNGSHGRLGHGGTEDEIFPRLVEGALVGKHVVSADGGKSHTMIVTSEGEVYSCGSGYCGKLGHGGMEGEREPRLIKSLVGKHIAGVAAGVDHSLVWSVESEVPLLHCSNPEPDHNPNLSIPGLLFWRRRIWAARAGKQSGPGCAESQQCRARGGAAPVSGRPAPGLINGKPRGRRAGQKAAGLSLWCAAIGIYCNFKSSLALAY